MTSVDPGSRVDVLGIPVLASDPDRVVAHIRERVRRRDPGYYIFRDVHGVIAAQKDDELMRIHEMAAAVCPDGLPLVWAAHRVGLNGAKRVSGPDLMDRLCEVAAGEGWRQFFYGGKEGVGQLLADRLSEKYPGTVIAGHFSPPFRPLEADERAAVIEQINSSHADIVWVGLSTPKQEVWMADIRPQLEAPILLGVGAAFDFHAGLIPRAPRWMQRSGFEWLYRLVHEPRRLWRRYLVGIPEFIWQILRTPPRRRVVGAETMKRVGPFE